MKFHNPFFVARRGTTRSSAFVAVTILAAILALGAVPGQAAATTTPSDYVTDTANAMQANGTHVFVPAISGDLPILTTDQMTQVEEDIVASGHPFYVVELDANQAPGSGNAKLVAMQQEFAFSFPDGVFLVFSNQGFGTNANGTPNVVSTAMPDQVAKNASTLFAEHVNDPSLVRSDGNQFDRIELFLKEMNDPATNPVTQADNEAYRSWMGSDELAQQKASISAKIQAAQTTQAVQAPLPATTGLASPFTNPQDAYPQAPSSASPVVVTLIILGIVFVLVAWPLLAAFRAWQRKNVRRAEEAYARGETVKIGRISITPSVDPTKDDDSA